MAVCVSFIATLAVTAGWLLAISYLDFQVHSLRRLEERSGQARRPPLVLERSLRLPWTCATWLVSGAAVLVVASFCALLHIGLLAVFVFAGGVFLGVVAVSDWSQLQARPSDRPARPAAWLYCTRGEYAGQRVMLDEWNLTIGRGEWNRLRLAERSVSRSHAQICCGRGHYYVQDLGSTHGTYLNEQRVDAIVLREGDRIRIGESEFEFSCSAPAPAARGEHAQPPAAWLDCLQGEHAGYRFALNNSAFGIGRAGDNALVLVDPSVSRHHAHIRYAQGRFYLQHVGSTHGTLLNGQRVTGSVLRDADCISIGGNVFEFHLL